ncbi:CAF17-like 4Fe-4S cluster assembly/insertion protein YgfZ [Deinococcus arcticus]|uniref:Folate-binding protein YgfZ n=1 Tax=Deinococcus arcticus TaxID=2136176 RepID=A0A2T3W801_9DEIO|nr:folate-binding protein YgfZ [Deinococcus arcticus]PTA68028.1 folate-binding protein YgfZ [Deinococcus arcticus]
MWTSIPSSSLRVTGADRVDFVHGQMTNHLRAAPTPGLVPCAFLNVRGQIEQFARVYRREQDVYLHLDEGQAGPLAARLRRYIIFDQVEVHDTTPELRTVHLWRPADLPGWDAEGADAQLLTLGGAAVLGGRVNRTGTPGVDLHYLARDEATLHPALGGPEVPLAKLDEARVAAGIPDIARDALGGTLPQEVGLDLGGPLPAISYRKGCYVGQEIMARLEARGQTRYHLARLQGTGGAGWPAGHEVTFEGRVVGQAGLWAGGASLARVRRDLPGGAAVQVGPVGAAVQPLGTHA